NKLAEWAVVHGRRYGTPRHEITDAIQQGRTVVLDIDVQGARQVRKMFPGA
ncbi:MAG: guanylate kinase, partial [Gemmatimonadetes bacterium]|nr:guanylate kinase [Gemmatimonadota bacterium]NIQ53717.1 guanylate kinase [Gemmatimonadota bacterium]NIU73887.1 guanylate kinase [Gammaproteobacteria bacterium]NIX19862.1 guanylate kinase [Actinomycetota bacterium]NIX43971.1 guanylate kinase [Gemmatimonadota bacterium]